MVGGDEAVLHAVFDESYDSRLWLGTPAGSSSLVPTPCRGAGRVQVQARGIAELVTYGGSSANMLSSLAICCPCMR